VKVAVALAFKITISIKVYISQQMGIRLLPKIGFSCNTGSTYPLKLLNSNTLSYSWVFTKASLLFWPVSESCSWPCFQNNDFDQGVNAKVYVPANGLQIAAKDSF